MRPGEIETKLQGEMTPGPCSGAILIQLLLCESIIIVIFI